MILLALLASFSIAPQESGASELPGILPLRERAAFIDETTRARLDTLVPRLMRREGIDFWVLVAREYNEDPVALTMLPAKWLAARRRTMLVFHDPGGDAAVERMAVARYAVGDLFPGAWDPQTQPDQWLRLAEIVAEKDPRRIALNVSSTFALADGLTHTEHGALLAALPERYRERVVSGENLAIGWLETRIPAELEVYPSLCRLAHGIIAEGFSPAAVQPGVTRTEDLEWWYRERILALGLDTWFHPTVSLQRPEGEAAEASFASKPNARVILRGDLLHVDFGIRYLGLCTDTQQHAYVLKLGEKDAPQGLRTALRAGNRLQDILTSQFATGATGNEMLAAALSTARAEGLKPTIYTHPLGLHGHGAGPLIGMWDMQDGVPGRGDYPLHPNTCHSIELATAVPVPEWNGKEVQIMLEEDALFDGESVRYLDGRQENLILIP